MKVYYPIFVDLSGRKVVVAGAGKVGLRKIRGLAAAGALVTAISPIVREPLPPGVQWLAKPYEDGDLEGAFLAYAATDSRETNAAIRNEANRRSIPVNVADAPGECDFLVPARIAHDDLQIAISTGGTNPGRAAAIRDRIEEFLLKTHQRSE